MLKKIFHSIVFSLVIVHVAICSEIFDGTPIWSYLTYLLELCFLIVGFQYFRKGINLNRLEKLSIFYFFYLFVLTIIYGKADTNLLPLIGRSLEIALLLMIVKLNEKDLFFYVISGSVVFSICVYCNFYSLLLNPLGFLNSDGEIYYLIGTNYNQIGPKVMFAFLFSVLLTYRYKIAIVNVIAVAVIGMISLFMVNSMTSAVSIIILLFIYLTLWIRPLKKIILYSLLFYIVFFQIFIVFGGNALNTTDTNMFLDLIGKDATFTGRTELWSYSSGYFWDSPVLGHGYISSQDYQDSGFFHGIKKTSHNYIYNILHKGGIILLFVIYQLIAISYHKIKKKFYQSNVYIIVLTGIVLMMMSLFEIYDSIYVYFLLIFMYYYDWFNIEKKDCEKLRRKILQ